MQRHSHIFNSLTGFYLLKTQAALVLQIKSLEGTTQSTVVTLCLQVEYLHCNIFKTAIVSLVDENLLLWKKSARS